MTRVPSRKFDRPIFFLAVVLACMIQVGSPSASEVVDIYLDQVTTTSPLRLANAFLEGWKDNFPDTASLNSLSPFGLRDSGANFPNNDQQQAINWLNGYAEARGNSGIYVHLVPPPWSQDSVNTGCLWEERFRSPVPLYPGGDAATWDCFLEHVRVVTDSVKAYRSAYPSLEFHYDIWNEPDHISSFVGTRDEFHQMWNATYKLIKLHDPEAIITGPSFAWFNLYAPRPDQCPGLNNDPAVCTRPYMLAFLEFCADSACVPDILGWHSFDDRLVTTPNDNNFYEQIDTVRAVIDSLREEANLPISVSRFEINEMMLGAQSPPGFGVHQYLQPGSMVRHFALAERARGLGLAYAGRTYWEEFWNQETNDGDGAWENGYLGGLVDPTPDGAYEKRAIWWAQKAYADIGDTLVRVDSTGAVDGLCGRSLVEKEAHILLGAYRSMPGSTVLVRVHGLGAIPGLVVNEVVEASVTKILGPGSTLPPPTGSQATPVPIETKRYLVVNGMVEIVIPGFGDNDAFTVDLRAITPGTTIAPG